MGRLLSVIVATALAGWGLDARSDAGRWWAHVKFLADDGLEGRDTGSAGHLKAAEYVAEHFRANGLEPAGTNGFIQPVRLRSRRVVEERSSLTLVSRAGSEPLLLGDEATLNMRVEHAPTLEAPLVFVGYGLSIPEVQHNDLEGIDLGGKIAVFLGGGPANLPGPLLAHAQSTAERWSALRKAGAVGTVAILNPRGMDIPWERSMLARFMPAMILADQTLNETAGQRVAVTVNPARAEKLFKDSGQSFAAILSLASTGAALPRFPLPAALKATVAFKATDVESQNVAGVLRGSDPTLQHEYVALSAHVDHVGVGQPINGDRIYNGAMDNASGVATLLEVASQAREARKRYKRSVLFLAVTAEEKGLLGSRYFANHPTVPRASIVANLNMDMFLPIFPMRSVIAQGLEESDLADDLQRVGQALGIAVLSDPEPERNAFIRSDQYSFIRQGIPALSLKVGYERNSPEAALAKKWRTERYHAPSDDLEQPIDLEAASKFNRLMSALVEAIANRDRAPSWHRESFFRRFAGS